MKTLVIGRKQLALTVMILLSVMLLLLLKPGEGVLRTALEEEYTDVPVTTEIYLNQAEIPMKGEEAINSDFYVEYRLERERTRGQRVAWLREVIDNVQSTDETRKRAQDNLLNISTIMEKEVELESLIKAKGYTDAVVLIDNMSVTAVIAAEQLDKDETADLTGFLARGTGVESNNVVIIVKH